MNSFDGNGFKKTLRLLPIKGGRRASGGRRAGGNKSSRSVLQVEKND